MVMLLIWVNEGFDWIVSRSDINCDMFCFHI